MAKHYEGWVRLNVEFEVDDDADDLAIEQEFNHSVEEAWANGITADDYDYWFEYQDDDDLDEEDLDEEELDFEELGSEDE